MSGRARVEKHSHIKKTITGTGIFGVKRECVVCKDLDFAQDSQDEKRAAENDRWFANKHEACGRRLAKFALPKEVCSLCGLASEKGEAHKTCLLAEQARRERRAAA